MFEFYLLYMIISREKNKSLPELYYASCNHHDGGCDLVKKFKFQEKTAKYVFIFLYIVTALGTELYGCLHDIVFIEKFEDDVMHMLKLDIELITVIRRCFILSCLTLLFILFRYNAKKYHRAQWKEHRTSLILYFTFFFIF